MKRWMWMLGILAAAGVATAIAQQPGGLGAGGPGGGRPPSPIVEALDADHDGVISADELKNATEALSKLDKNKDSKLTDDEFRPQGGRPGQAGSGGGRPKGEGPRDRPEDRPSAGPGERDRGAGGPPPGGGRGGEAQSRRPEGGGPGGPGTPGGRGPGGGGQGAPGRGPGGQGGGPAVNPDRMLTHAMEFDADKDGKLSQDELKKFIADFIKLHPGPDGGAGGGRPGAGGPGGGGGPPNGGGGRPNEGGERPERPRRPE